MNRKYVKPPYHARVVSTPETEYWLIEQEHLRRGLGSKASDGGGGIRTHSAQGQRIYSPPRLSHSDAPPQGSSLPFPVVADERMPPNMGWMGHDKDGVIVVVVGLEKTVVPPGDVRQDGVA